MRDSIEAPKPPARRLLGRTRPQTVGSIEGGCTNRPLPDAVASKGCCPGRRLILEPHHPCVAVLLAPLLIECPCGILVHLAPTSEAERSSVHDAADRAVTARQNPHRIGSGILRGKVRWHRRRRLADDPIAPGDRKAKVSIYPTYLLLLPRWAISENRPQREPNRASVAVSTRCRESPLRVLSL
jgi:hypothetical protein